LPGGVIWRVALQKQEPYASTKSKSFLIHFKFLQLSPLLLFHARFQF